MSWDTGAEDFGLVSSRNLGSQFLKSSFFLYTHTSSFSGEPERNDYAVHSLFLIIIFALKPVLPDTACSLPPKFIPFPTLYSHTK